MTPENTRQTWRSLLLRVASLLIAYGLLIVGNALSSTQTSLALSEMGASLTLTGFVQSAYYLGFFLGGFYCSRIVYRYGHHRTFAVLAALTCVASLLQSLLESPWVWAAMRFINGLTILGIYMVVESWLHASVSNAQRGQLFSLYMIISYLGASAGQWLLRLPFTQTSWQFVVVAMLFALSIIPVTLTQQSPLAHQAPPSKNALSLTKNTLQRLHQCSPLGLYGMLITGCLASAFYALLPVVLNLLNYSKEGVGDFMGLALLAGPLLQWPMGRWGDTSKRRSDPLLYSVVLVFAIALMLSLWRNPDALLPLMFIYVAIFFTFYSSLSGLANSAMPVEYRVELSAVLLMLYALGGIFGPLLGAFLMAQFGIEGYFILTLILTLPLGFLIGWSRKE